MYIWVVLHHRHQISIVTDAVFLGYILQFTLVQVTPGLCHPWESQEKGWYLQDTVASSGREPQEAGVEWGGQHVPILQKPWE